MAKRKTGHEAASEVVRNYVLATFDEKTKREANLAAWDLLFGPISTDPESAYGPDDGLPWCGFSQALNNISNALPPIGDLWVEGDVVMTAEPEGYYDEETEEYVEPYLDDTYKFSRKDALVAAFGKNLAPYIA